MENSFNSRMRIFSYFWTFYHYDSKGQLNNILSSFNNRLEINSTKMLLLKNGVFNKLEILVLKFIFPFLVCRSEMRIATA